MTKMERAESKDAMVEIATLEATSLNDVDVEQMATELFDILATTVKDDALTIVQEITNFNGFEAWRRMVARYAPSDPATALVAESMSPQRPKGLNELVSAIETWELQLNALAKDRDESLSPPRARSRASSSGVLARSGSRQWDARSSRQRHHVLRVRRPWPPRQRLSLVPFDFVLLNRYE